MPRCPTRAPASSRRKPSTIPRPARSTGTIVISASSRRPGAGSSGVSIVCATVGRSRVDSTARIAEASLSAWRKAPCGVDASRRTARRSSRTGCWTTVRPSGMPARDYICCAAMETRLLIAGEQVAGEGPGLDVENPYTQTTLATVALPSPEQVDAAIGAARAAARAWADTPAVERCELLHEVAARLRAQRGHPGRADDARGRQAARREHRRGRLDGGRLRLLRRDGPQLRRPRDPHRSSPRSSRWCSRSRWASWRRSCRGTTRCCCSRGSSRRRWRPATRCCASRRSSRRSRPSRWRRASITCRRAW